MSALDKKEKILIEHLLSSKEAFVKCFRILKPSYFSEPMNDVVDFILKYFAKYSNIPNTKIIESETDVLLDIQEISPDEYQYFLDEIESFCQEKAMFEAILAGVDLVHEGKTHEVQELVRQALMVKLDTSIGINVYENARERIENMDLNVEQRKLGLKALDDLVDGVRRGELGMVFAATAGGKSVMLANIAKWLSEQGCDGIVISLELREDLYAKRFDAIITGCEIKKHKLLAAEIDKHLKQMSETSGRIIVKKMKYGTTASEIRSVVMEYVLLYGKSPDFLIVDYIGLMGAGKTSGKSFNKSDEDELKAFGLRDIILDHNMYGFSAGQINRDGYDVKTLGPSHVAGGISVINASDWSVGLVATEVDIENNQVQLAQMKVRNAEKTIHVPVIYRCPKTLRFTDKPSGNAGVKSSPTTETNPIKTRAMGKSKLENALKIGRKK